MSTIKVQNLQKIFKVYDKDAGLKGSIKSLFHKKYRQVKAVDKISFEIDKGELVGFIGPNGAGKTTTLKMLSGLLYPDGGSVEVLGFEPFERKYEFLRKISLVMGQKNQLWWDLPPIETFLLNKEIYEIPEEKFKKTMDSLVEMLDVGKVLKTQVRKLSLGQRMKCELIAALLHQPEVLFLDEPTIGLDVIMQSKVRNFVKEYNQQFNSTIILTSHYMDDVKQLCKRVIVVDEGKLLFDGKLTDLVNKYAKKKIIKLVLAKNDFDKEYLQQFAEIISFEGNHVVFAVDYDQVSNVAAKLLKALDVVDLNIEEVPLEQVISEVFNNHE